MDVLEIQIIHLYVERKIEQLNWENNAGLK
jgi:hypothetical protein